MIPRDRRRDDETPAGLAHHVRTGRLEAFSDGVFAIAITLLVLEITIPVARPVTDLLDAVVDEWPSYLAYVLSFSTVGADVAGAQRDHRAPRPRATAPSSG